MTHLDLGANHAVVIGASMAGLLAARALADHYEHVTVVERDALPTGPAARAGVPQARHIHILLMCGQRLLEQQFPGIQVELATAGAPLLSLTHDFRIFQQGRWSPRCESDLAVRTFSRDLLEALVRQHLRGNGHVRFLEQHIATGLLGSEDRRAVVGIRVQAREAGQELGPPRDLPAALVVDASGRESRTPQWLAAIGAAPPAETRIDSGLAYASRWYRRPATAPRTWQAVVVNGQAPREPYGGGVYPVEGNRWIVSLGGIGGVAPPADEAGFLAFARMLPRPVVYDAIADAEPLTPIYGYRRTANRLRHYERLATMPDSLVVLGDAVCAFNPVYGQGMTVAAMGAKVLADTLSDHRRAAPDGTRTGMSRQFQRRLARVNATPWLLATGADLGWPTTVGGHASRRDRLVQHYVDRVIRAMADDPHVLEVFLEVVHLLRPPAALFQPAVVAAVSREALRTLTLTGR